jgi:hypothetical protein
MSASDELAGSVTLIYLNVDTNVFGHRYGGSSSTGLLLGQAAVAELLRLRR